MGVENAKPSKERIHGPSQEYKFWCRYACN